MIAIEAMKRVVRAPGLILLAAALHLGLAALAGSTVQAAVAANMAGHAVLADGRRLFQTVSMTILHPGVPAVAGQLLGLTVVVSVIFWTLVAGGVIRRLHAPAPAAEVAATAVGRLPAMVVVSLWHLLPRALLLAGCGALTARLWTVGAWGLAGVVLTLLASGYAACALDLARVNVVLHGARRFHPMTAVDGFLQAARQPSLLLPALTMSTGQWLCALAIPAVVMLGDGSSGAAWGARALALAGVAFGLTRIAVAVQAAPYRQQSAAASPLLARSQVVPSTPSEQPQQPSVPEVDPSTPSEQPQRPPGPEVDPSTPSEQPQRPSVPEVDPSAHDEPEVEEPPHDKPDVEEPPRREPDVEEPPREKPEIDEPDPQRREALELAVSGTRDPRSDL